MVLWRPGLTIWLIAWGNENSETQAERLAWNKGAASPARFAERETVTGGATRYDYRLRDQNEDGVVESLSAFVIGDKGHLQMSIYFDDPADEPKAWLIAESVALRR